jgi:5-methylthioadenosine/S-adenosylhomocysteine deaminase
MTPLNYRLPLIDTGGTVFPGLIELHNHLPYNYLPLWDVPKKFTDRNTWRLNEPKYNPAVAWPARILSSNPDLDYPRAIARFSECRSLLGGVTTGEGITVSSAAGAVNYYQGLVRNVEAPDDATWPTGLGHTLDFTQPEIAGTLWPALQIRRPFFYHLSEGTDAVSQQRYMDLDMNGTWAVNANLVAIHCTALQATDFTRMAAAAGIVWSPLSNYLLYGKTTEIAAAKQAGVRIALGADWSPSGSKNLLGELKIAKIVSDNAGGLFSSEDLVRMATITPAKMTQWDPYIGSIEAGKKADLLVVSGGSADGYGRLLEVNESDVVFVFINGRARLAREELAIFDPSAQEVVTIGGTEFVLDLHEDTSTPLDGMRLSTAVAKLTYGLEHIPELGKTLPKALEHTLKFAPAATWGIELDYDDASLHHGLKLAIADPIDPTQLYPMELAPITEVDDPNFRSSLRANGNIPDFLRTALG